MVKNTQNSLKPLRGSTEPRASRRSPRRCAVLAWRGGLEYLCISHIEEREREGDRYVCVYIYIFIYLFMYVFMYLYDFYNGPLRFYKGLRWWYKGFLGFHMRVVCGFIGSVEFVHMAFTRHFKEVFVSGVRSLLWHL